MGTNFLFSGGNGRISDVNAMIYQTSLQLVQDWIIKYGHWRK